MTGRPRPTLASVVSLLVLFIAPGGTAVAAQHYLLTSTKQISHKLLKALRGRTGPRGSAGLPGSRGVPGPQGVQGGAGQHEMRK
jgi:hypothetical protein